MPRWKWFQRKDEPVDVVERAAFAHRGEQLRPYPSDVIVGGPHDVAGSRPSAGLVTPEEVADARRLAGNGLAAARRAAGVTQMCLARMVSWSRSTVANVETARQSAPMAFWAACDAVLGGEGALLAEWERVEVLSRRLREQKAMELFRQRLARRSPGCACPDHPGMLAEPDASVSLDRSSAAFADAEGSGRG
ncbi:helix-turn-helix transcriptional regulator [Micromonospora sp. WMMD882]|uniref:helix-turn-helix domain-containing protein n=1 Tax=Micromonospora sp. WMMD882 TaxID=3015151 RepID=UPI00248B8B5C|nr:helix-turn-helix transcriptional regulator [Micromonospora sp. WMMD882]WBB79742.1 helix-turn-helix transcriptional regulator [Micromonospora sp. WMMD882]